MLKQNDLLLNKYKILSIIAKGGMGYVWLAEDVTLKKHWAVKEIYKSSKEYKASVNPDGTLTEIEILTLLDNPYAPRIVDRYEDDEVLAVVMDYVEGKNLLQVVKEDGPQDEEKVIEWAMCICDLLSFLHTHNPKVFYNDIKPENIILKDDGSIKVIDFGISKMPEKYPNKTPIGTPGYASPEHYRGNTDARSDIYSLGFTMYHLLTADSPCVNNFKMPKLRTQLPGASKKLEEIIEKATQRSPEKRFQTAAELRQALFDYQVGQIIPENTKTTLLQGSEPVKQEDVSVEEATSEKQTPAVTLTKTPAANLFTVLYEAVAGLIRILLYIIIGVLTAIGIDTLLEPTLRTIFFEQLQNMWDIAFH